ncbi:MAG: S46 family peptidase [Allosphingosinicella sp.]|uniref:S46 family peptidase n=1 Tax=Allosphingosinicella sp. TaxID=2823234 RepID=UPI00392A905F
MHVRFLSGAAAAALAAAFLPAAPAAAEEGMWTFDAFPTERVRQAYGWAPDRPWLDRVQAAAVRLTGGCSASFVSPEGLVLTNHHCVVSCVQDLSTEQNDLVAAGFTAATRGEERQCPGQQAEVVTAISDVTARVQAAIGTSTGAALARARDAAIAAIESESCTDPERERCQVVTLYGGGEYKLYRYRKYSDVRLAFAPEFQAAFFGGDPDNFNFPRYALDAAFLRVYENGRPAATPAHLRWNPRAPQPGEPTFVVGNPGSTQRLFTQGQFAMRRDTIFPVLVPLFAEYRGRLISAMAGDAERTRTGADMLFGVENSYKVYIGQWQALRDREFSGRLAAAEQDLRGRVAADPALAGQIGDPWAEVDAATATYADFYTDYLMLEANAGFRSSLFSYARALVRAAAERDKPEAERLPGYTASRLPLLEKQVTDAAPVYPWLEELSLGFWLSKTRELLGADDPRVRELLGRESPEAIAARLVGGTRLGDEAERRRLWEGGMAAIQASDDPLIRFVLATDPVSRAQLDRFRAEVDAPITAAQSRLARARFAAYGDSVYPDATFTLRISYGSVQGWTERGQDVPPVTRIGGLFERATGAPPYDLAPLWAAARDRLDQDVVFNFVSTNDIIGGNSGSPVIARDGSVIGTAFDGNIHSIGGSYGFDPRLNRTVSVSAAAVQEAMAKIYGADALLAELNRAPARRRR